MGYGEESANDLATKVTKKAQHRKRWNKAKVLIIDEVSMLSGIIKIDDLFITMINNNNNE